MGQIELMFSVNNYDSLSYQQIGKRDFGCHFQYELSSIGWDLFSYLKVLDIMEVYN